jgi:hypothetical protein
MGCHSQRALVTLCLFHVHRLSLVMFINLSQNFFRQSCISLLLILFFLLFMFNPQYI